MPPSLKALLWPEWLSAWLRFQALPALGLETQQLTLGVLKGIFDTLLLLLLGLGILTGGRIYMDGQYALPPATQNTVLKWAPVAEQIARKTDIPREVPLVLWFKESSMQAVNPDNCIGIMGTYDLVRSGERPCFTPGPISDLEVSRQMALGAAEFKKRCPEITYWTQDPETIKRCYLAYNAGAGAAKTRDPNRSAYVMNNFDAAHTNMIYTDIELGTVRMTSLGAWPAHLAMQSLIVSQLDMEKRPFSIALVDVSNRLYDWAAYTYGRLRGDALRGDAMTFPAVRDADQFSCLKEPRIGGLLHLRPRLNPVTVDPILTQDVHGCSYNLPGVDISSRNSHAMLQAPLPGEVTTYTDRWYNSTIRIENAEWIVWMLHPRSYIVEEGAVKRGDPVGVMGAVGYATGPHVHYSIYDKRQEAFVDPRFFLP
jgi:hypothetical protein